MFKPLTLVSALFALVPAGVFSSIPPPTATVAITAAPPHSATGELFILQSDTNAVALHNPVLVVEGFDISNEMNWPELYELLNQEDLLVDVRNFGRDLIVLNFGDSTADIIANSALTETALKYVNANRADASDKFTAVGASLGGLTLRKALVDLPNHDVDTWVSFDAPHEGANMPLGMQEFFEYFSTINIEQFDQMREFLAILNTPAVRQMLVTHRSNSPDAPAGASAPERQDFVDLMNATAYPTNCRTVAISNGSGYGEKLPFEAGDLIIRWYHFQLFFGPNIDTKVYVLPQSTFTPAPVFSGQFSSAAGGASPKTVSSYHPLSFDNAPGGYRPTFLQVFTNLTYIDGNDILATTNHCFVPTVSALGIPIENLESNLAVNASLTDLSPFDEIHFAPHNERHVEINLHNKRWLMRSVLSDQDSDGDGFDDYQEYLLGTDFNSAESTLTVESVMAVDLNNGEADLSWNTYSNTQYQVYFVTALEDSWQWQETIPPGSAAALNKTYLINTASNAGFFKIVATLIDPVTD
ncbi:hypothetical protein P4B35_03300 [Pontiellaceae bacterium B12227]|nr:hypothetical protein [Pontiellaceae bacterium B12227]